MVPLNGKMADFPYKPSIADIWPKRYSWAWLSIGALVDPLTRNSFYEKIWIEMEVV